MPLRAQLTERLGIEHPILGAPMAFAAGGRLAAAVTEAGGLGLIGGGYGNAEWVEREFAAAGNTRVGCGFITWSLARQPELLDRVLSHAPAALMLSFGDPAPFRAGHPTRRQCPHLPGSDPAPCAAGPRRGGGNHRCPGNGSWRPSRLKGNLTLTPEIADLLARENPDTLLVSAGGIADGRGLAAVLMLGADGVLVGSRLWASEEALVHPNHHRAAIAASGDDTVRQRAADIVRLYTWPDEFTGRVLRNAFTESWANREDELRQQAETLNPSYQAGIAAGDPDNVAVWVGEAAGLIDRVHPAARINSRYGERGRSAARAIRAPSARVTCSAIEIVIRTNQLRSIPSE